MQSIKQMYPTLLSVVMSRSCVHLRSRLWLHSSSKCLVRGHLQPQTGFTHYSGNTHNFVVSLDWSRVWISSIVMLFEWCRQETPRPDALYRLLEVELRGHDTAVMNSYVKFVSMACEELEINLNSVEEPWRNIYRRSILRSAFVNKKHREQYEMRTYFRILKIKHVTGSTADTFLEYIQRNLPEGIAMQVRRHQLEPLPDHIISKDSLHE